MAKERNYNPVQAQRKADKAKAIKKGKADVAAARNERLAKKNPDRIRKQIDDLKAISEGGGKLTQHEQQVLEGLEKELKAVIKARDALGDRAPALGGDGRGGRSGGGGFGSGGGGGGGGGGQWDRKRRRDDESSDSGGDDVPDDVRRIPMPRDTPPPIPKAALDAWYEKRRARARARHAGSGGDGHGSSANAEPLGSGGGSRGAASATTTTTAAGTAASVPAAAPPKPPPVVAKTVYEAKPVLRDLQKEAVTAFMPTVVRRKLEKSRGANSLLEPEEADQLEREGYLPSAGAAAAVPPPAGASKSSPEASIPGRHRATLEDVESEDEG